MSGEPSLAAIHEALLDHRSNWLHSYPHMQAKDFSVFTLAHGISACFWKVTPEWGFKLYYREERQYDDYYSESAVWSAEANHDLQLQAYNLGIAPKPGRIIQDYFFDRLYTGFLTEVATPLRDVPSDIREKTEFSAKWFDLINTMELNGFSTNDLSDNNSGIIADGSVVGRLVCIDFSHTVIEPAASYESQEDW